MVELAEVVVQKEGLVLRLGVGRENLVAAVVHLLQLLMCLVKKLKIVNLIKKENNYKFDHQGNSTLIINPHEQILGVSPNYVHSMDGAALMKCVALAKNHQLYNFQVIHDAFATYACDTPKLIQCIKQRSISFPY